ncbi:hypothetical protein DX116_00645 [Aeromicrobium endophyticum]|uniref:Uncharacterized protein n=2 Tax=Aeromicrobium endophyticum TaxID=2292704 RepID=A0A371P8E5_9ACTN|nr:hypothetical protein DX116_00645 [Aeromicrobium endophyticum]
MNGYKACMTSDPTHARNDNDDSTTDEDGQLANPGPVPVEAEDASDTGEGRPGDLTAEAGPDQDAHPDR